MRRGDNTRYHSAKKLTMHRLLQMDHDIAPRYEEDDDSQIPPPRYLLTRRFIRDRLNPNRIVRKAQDGDKLSLASLRNSLENRKERQIQMSSGGSSSSQAVIMNQIRIVRGVSIGKDFLLRAIGQYVDDVKPILLKADRMDIIFFVDNDETASAIQAISRRLRDPVTSSPVTIISKKAPVGFSAVGYAEFNLLKNVLSKRYNPENHSLDLSDFGLDDEFRSKSLYFSLCQNNIMMAVIELIDTCYGSITSLSVKGNRLRFLDHFSCLIYRIKNIRTLDLSSNQIDKASELMKLKGWPVETLFFENNPLCSEYGSAEAYLSAIHGVFPKVTSLDGIPVQRPIDLPDLDEETSIPLPKPSFYGSAECKELIEKFITQYMAIYDSADTNDRKSLIDAYDENATFSLSVENLPDANNSRPSFEYSTYNIYRKMSHNIIHLSKWEHYREKVIHKGAMEIIVQLKKLPPTTHLFDTFVVDVSLIKGNIMCFTLQGFFRDVSSNGKDSIDISSVRYFCRDFVIVNKDEGKIAILSDILFISGVFAERIQRYKTMLTNMMKIAVTDFSVKEEQNAEQPTTSNVAISERTPAELAAAGDERLQQLMIESFSRESQMKPDWSRKCLMDQNWNYELAGKAFLAVRDKIPPEAFQ